MMGHNKEKTIPSKKSNKFDIPEGLVSRRRAELIAAKFSGYGTMTFGDIPVLNRPELADSEARTTLSHPTKSRPKMLHRTPSRKSHQLSSLKNEFFIENLQSQSEAICSDLPGISVESLNKVILNAKSSYHKHYLYGTNSRQVNGWFSWWRHGGSGQSIAEDISIKSQQIDSIDSLLNQMNLFFMDPKTRYNNHSFASYLLDELNKLVKSFSLPGCKPEAEMAYDKDSWLVIVAQLQQLVSLETKGNSHVISIS